MSARKVGKIQFPICGTCKRHASKCNRGLECRALAEGQRARGLGLVSCGMWYSVLRRAGVALYLETAYRPAVDGHTLTNLLTGRSEQIPERPEALIKVIWAPRWAVAIATLTHRGNEKLLSASERVQLIRDIATAPSRRERAAAAARAADFVHDDAEKFAAIAEALTWDPHAVDVALVEERNKQPALPGVE